LPATISLRDKWFSLNYKRTLEDGGDRMKRGRIGQTGEWGRGHSSAKKTGYN